MRIVCATITSKLSAIYEREEEKECTKDILSRCETLRVATARRADLPKNLVLSLNDSVSEITKSTNTFFDWDFRVLGNIVYYVRFYFCQSEYVRTFS